MDPTSDKSYGYDQNEGAAAPAPPAYTPQSAQHGAPAQGYGTYPQVQPGAGAYPQGAMPPPQPPPPGQTVVIVNNPQQSQFGPRSWVNGLCGCFNNCTVCILTWFVPCYVNGVNAEALGESCILHGVLSAFFPLCVQVFLRIKIRERLNITGSGIGDCCTVWCCAPCALAQERNELLSAVERGELIPPVMERM